MADPWDQFRRVEQPQQSTVDWDSFRRVEQVPQQPEGPQFTASEWGDDYKSALQAISALPKDRQQQAKQDYARFFVDQERAKRQSTTLGAIGQELEDYGRGFAQNIPVIGELAGPANAATAAALGGDYEMALMAENERRRQATEQDRPALQTPVGEIDPLDAVKSAGFVTGAVAAPYARVGGAGASGAVNAAAYGGGEAAAQSIGRGNEIGQAAQDGLRGAALSAPFGYLGGRAAQAIDDYTSQGARFVPQASEDTTRLQQAANPDELTNAANQTIQNLRNEANAAYAAARDSGVRFNSTGTRNLTHRLQTVFSREAVPEEDALLRPAMRRLERMRTAMNDYMPMRASDVEEVRFLLNQSLPKADDRQRRIIGMMKDQVDDFVDDGQRFLQLGTPDDLAAYRGAVAQGRDLVRRRKTLEPVAARVDRKNLQNAAAHTGGDYYNNMKKGMRELLTSERFARSLSHGQRQQMRRFIQRGKPEDFLHMVGRFDPTSGSLRSQLGALGFIGGITGLPMGVSVPLGAAALISTRIARSASDAKAQRSVANIMASIARGKLRREFTEVQKAFQAGANENVRAVALQAFADKAGKEFGIDPNTVYTDFIDAITGMQSPEPEANPALP